jgi:hypothetical protein
MVLDRRDDAAREHGSEEESCKMREALHDRRSLTGASEVRHFELPQDSPEPR